MTRKIIRALLGFTLRIFFRRIEVVGLERVPEQSPLIFVMNHPNALVDPLFVLCLAPRPVSFLAKAPLFRMPVVGFFVRALDSLPVYRHQDGGENTMRNRETFERCRATFRRGGTIAMFPEGVSHNEPNLRPLKTGAARIALGAVGSNEGASLNLKIVPAGLYYTAKKTFRSTALLYFGAPVTIEHVALEPDGEPPREAVHTLSKRIEDALRDVTLNAEHEESLSVVARAETIFSSNAQANDDERTLARELVLRRRFVEGYELHQRRSPTRLATLEARIRRYEEDLNKAGINPQILSPVPYSAFKVARYTMTRACLFILLFPLALTGAGLHYPAYRLVGFCAMKFAGENDDVVSTVKVLAAALLFPLTWICVAALCFAFAGWWGFAAAMFLTPVAGYATLLFIEQMEEFAGAAKAFVLFVTRRRFFNQLLAERQAICNEIMELDDPASGQVETNHTEVAEHAG